MHSLVFNSGVFHSINLAYKQLRNAAFKSENAFSDLISYERFQCAV